MIDCELDVFNDVAAVVRNKYPKIYMVGEYVKSPPSFPCVMLVQEDSVSYQKTQDTASTENHVQVLYELTVCSNKTSGKKTECKEIAALADTELISLGFARTMLKAIPNELDASIYRLVGRYKAVISKNNVVYRK